MKKLLLLFFFVGTFLSSDIVVGQGTVVPNTGLRGQSLQTTITLPAGTMFNASPPMGYQDIYLQQGATIIYANPSYSSTLDWYNSWDPWMMTYVYTDSGRPTFDIPANAPNGYYDVVVITYPTPWWGSTNTITNGFFIGVPAGTIQGTVYFDANQNGINDVTEIGISGGVLRMSPSNDYVFTDALGDFIYYADSGNYTTSFTLPGGYTQTSLPLTYNATVPPSVTGQDFGAFSAQVYYGHSPSITRWRTRCNESSGLVITISNSGVAAVQDRVTLITSSNYIFNSATNPPDIINGDTLTWIYPMINPQSTVRVGGANLIFTAPAALQNVLIQVIDSMFDLSGNLIDVFYDTYGYEVRCSYDPNDKHVSPEGVMSQNYTPINSELTFLVNFQNTGNDTAYNIHILDTLDSDLDLATFEVVSSSHLVNTQMTPSGALRFNFFNIMLPDSGADELGSHGYVLYRISPKAGLPDPTVINNTSYIIFDQNAPIITNTTMNTLTAIQYPQSNFTTADVSICESNCISFTNQAAYGTTYQWNFPGGSPSSSTSFDPGSICYPTSGAYDVTLITSNTFGSDTLVQRAYINVAVSPGVFSVVQIGDSLISPQGYFSYQWYYNNVLIGGATSYFYVATQAGDYGLIVGNSNGCESGVNIANVTIGIDDIVSGKALAIYPNPSKGQFELSFNSNENQNVVISIFDKVGQLIQLKNVSVVSGPNTISMEENNLSAGIYTIQMTSKSKVISKILMINK